MSNRGEQAAVSCDAAGSHDKIERSRKLLLDLNGILPLPMRFKLLFSCEEPWNVPYIERQEFARQQMSLWAQWYENLQSQHSLYADHLRFLQADAVNIFQPANQGWLQAAGGVTQINAAGIAPELEEAVQRFGGL